jgi:hypothetical protein
MIFSIFLTQDFVRRANHHRTLSLSGFLGITDWLPALTKTEYPQGQMLLIYAVVINVSLRAALAC